jgi:hypothetical protein
MKDKVKLEHCLLKFRVFRQHHYTNATWLSLSSKLFLTEGQTTESWVPSKLSNLSKIENHEESYLAFSWFRVFIRPWIWKSIGFEGQDTEHLLYHVHDYLTVNTWVTAQCFVQHAANPRHFAAITRSSTGNADSQYQLLESYINQFYYLSEERKFVLSPIKYNYCEQRNHGKNENYTHNIYRNPHYGNHFGDTGLYGMTIETDRNKMSCKPEWR